MQISEKQSSGYFVTWVQLSCYLSKKTGVIRNGIKTDADSRYNLYDYSYTSSNSSYSKNYWEQYAKNLSQELNITDNFRILEIGSNDGYLLKCFKKYKITLEKLDRFNHFADI